MSCTTCTDLEQALAAAEKAGDRTRAVDCRVLLRRHPAHDGVPVAAGARSQKGEGGSE
ncbi:hypothetical protein SAMN05216511_1123 [Streptomyces sp. KS_16]|nr:hypothetical protein SAMN05216511_1123 [Streptomyces sp. KS_16]